VSGDARVSGDAWVSGDARVYDPDPDPEPDPEPEPINSDPHGNSSTHTLPVDSAARKDYPLFEGVLKYFPAALAGVAKVSKDGNDKHNPGQPLHHSRGKSMDHGDCILRHMTDMSEDFGKGVGRDEKGIPQVFYVAWRALCMAQEYAEKHLGTPMAPNAREMGK
jgi:hypothetical protein